MENILPDHQTYAQFMNGVKRKRRLPRELWTKGFPGSPDPSLKVLIKQGKIKMSFARPYLTIPETVIFPPPSDQEVKNFMEFKSLAHKAVDLERTIRIAAQELTYVRQGMEKLKKRSAPKL